MGQKKKKIVKQLESILKHIELNKTENRAKQIKLITPSFCFKIQRSGKSKAFTLKKKKKKRNTQQMNCNIVRFLEHTREFRSWGKHLVQNLRKTGNCRERDLSIGLSKVDTRDRHQREE